MYGNQLPSDVQSAVGRLRAVNAAVLKDNIGREEYLQVLSLTVLTGNPCFFVGPPGVSKTKTAQEWALHVKGARFFDVNMGGVKTSDELFLPKTCIVEEPMPNGGKRISIEKQIGGAGQSEIVFLDELPRAEPSMMNEILDLMKGGDIRYGGGVERIPLRFILTAGNRMIDPNEADQEAFCSRITLRLMVKALDRAGKRRLALHDPILDTTTTMTLQDIDLLQKAVKQIRLPEDIVDAALDIYEAILKEKPQDYAWLWSDDRRFKRLCRNVLRAQALLEGRTVVNKSDLKALKHVLWDTIEEISFIEKILKPYLKTPVTEAQQLLDAMMAAGDVVDGYLKGINEKASDAKGKSKTLIRKLEEFITQTSGSDQDGIKKILVEAQAVDRKISYIFDNGRR